MIRAIDLLEVRFGCAMVQLCMRTGVYRGNFLIRSDRYQNQYLIGYDAGIG